MHLRLIVSSALLALLAVSSSGQRLFISHTLSEVQGIESSGSRTFTETSLYGYINGGAELYLEYGFDTLIVAELVSDGRDIKVEAYRMKDPEAAFGIFSVSRFRCNGGPRLTQHICRSAYQVQFAKGPYYVSIVNDTGTEADQKKSAEIASFIIGQIPDPSFDPCYFYTDGVDEETMKGAVLVRGPLGIYNGIPTLTEKLGEASHYSALMIRRGQDTLASLRFNDNKSVNDFMRTKNLFPTGEESAVNSDTSVSVIAPNHIIITF
jgi:hypothetical protein